MPPFIDGLIQITLISRFDAPLRHYAAGDMLS